MYHAKYFINQGTLLASISEGNVLTLMDTSTPRAHEILAVHYHSAGYSSLVDNFRLKKPFIWDLFGWMFTLRAATLVSSNVSFDPHKLVLSVDAKDAILLFVE